MRPGLRNGVTLMSEYVRRVLSIDWDALRTLGERAEQGHLQDGDLALVGLLVRTVFEFAALRSQRDATLARLRRLLFGSRSERRQQSSSGGRRRSMARSSTKAGSGARRLAAGRRRASRARSRPGSRPSSRATVWAE
jgi:hypothetical protein